VLTIYLALQTKNLKTEVNKLTGEIISRKVQPESIIV